MVDKEEGAGDEVATVWRPRDYYDPPPELPYAVILLNKGVTEANVGSVRQWWCSAHLRVCVDGATNAFHHLMQQRQESTAASPPVSCPLPDVISGDFDSVSPDLLEMYAAKGVRVVPTPDQDETDFTKALRVLASLLEEQHTAACEIVSAPVVVVSGRSLYWVLRSGRHSIRVPGELCHHPSVSWCGLVPMGQPTTATTTGLKWNIDHQTLAFGQLVSTSNTYNLPPGGGEVTVATSSPLLWTMGWKAEPTEPGHSPPEHSDLQNGSLDNT